MSESQQCLNHPGGGVKHTWDIVQYLLFLGSMLPQYMALSVLCVKRILGYQGVMVGGR